MNWSINWINPPEYVKSNAAYRLAWGYVLYLRSNNLASAKAANWLFAAHMGRAHFKFCWELSGISPIGPAQLPAGGQIYLFHQRPGLENQNILKVASPDWSFHSRKCDTIEFIRELNQAGVKVILFHLGTESLKSIIKRHDLDPRIVIACSGDRITFWVPGGSHVIFPGQHPLIEQQPVPAADAAHLPAEQVASQTHTHQGHARHRKQTNCWSKGIWSWFTR